jgi:hypothetical protein
MPWAVLRKGIVRKMSIRSMSLKGRMSACLWNSAMATSALLLLVIRLEPHDFLHKHSAHVFLASSWQMPSKLP